MLLRPLPLTASVIIKKLKDSRTGLPSVDAFHVGINIFGVATHTGQKNLQDTRHMPATKHLLKLAVVKLWKHILAFLSCCSLYLRPTRGLQMPLVKHTISWTSSVLSGKSFQALWMCNEILWLPCERVFLQDEHLTKWYRRWKMWSFYKVSITHEFHENLVSWKTVHTVSVQVLTKQSLDL